jgi:hypothetical protein
MGNPVFPVIHFFSAAVRRVTPTLPKEGEAACGEHPLDSLFFKSIIFGSVENLILFTFLLT